MRVCAVRQQNGSLIFHVLAPFRLIPFNRGNFCASLRPALLNALTVTHNAELAQAKEEKRQDGKRMSANRGREGGRRNEEEKRDRSSQKQDEIAV